MTERAKTETYSPPRLSPKGKAFFVCPSFRFWFPGFQSHLFFRRRGATLLLLVLLASQPASAADFELTLFATNRANLTGGYRDVNLLYDSINNVYDTSTYLTPSPRDLYYSGFFDIGLKGYLTDWLTGRLELNTGEVRYQSISLDGTTNLVPELTTDGRSVPEEAQANGYVREAMLDFHDPTTQWWSLRIGRHQWKVGGSLVYDDYGFGAELSLDFDLKKGQPFRFDLLYLVPSRDFQPFPVASPFVTARLDYILSLYETLSLSLSFFRDGDGELTEVIRQAVVERVLNLPPNLSPSTPFLNGESLSEYQQVALFCYLNSPFEAASNLVYAAFTGNKILPFGTLDGALVLEGGQVSVNGAPHVGLTCQTQSNLLTFPTFGGAFNVYYHMPLTKKLTLSAFTVGESGSIPPSHDTYYNAYLGLTPFITDTQLFFQGGLFETYGARRAVPAGVNGRGVLGGGLDAVYVPFSKLMMKGIVAPLFSWAPGIPKPVGNGGSFYGLELDSLFDYHVLRFLGLVAEADIIVGSTFYAQSAPIWKLIAGVDLAETWNF